MPRACAECSVQNPAASRTHGGWCASARRVQAMSSITYPGEQGNLRPEEGDHRADLRDCERTARVPVYAIHRESTDGDEGRAHLCVYELKETGKDSRQKGARGTAVPRTSVYFKEDISQDKREVLESGSGTSLCLQSDRSTIKNSCCFVLLFFIFSRSMI